MIMAKIKISFDMPILNLQPELMKIAERIIIPDVQGRMNTGVDLEDKPYRSLTEKTITRKQKDGLRTEPLLATGQLRRSPKAEVVGVSSVRITPAGNRKSLHGERTLSNKELADILQNQGVRARAGKRFFEFFGISQKAEVKAIKTMRNFIKDAIRRGGRKTIR